MTTRRQLLGAAGLAIAAPAGLAVAASEFVNWPVMTLLDGQVLKPEDWRDMAAVLVFWTTWCPYCRRHNARIDRLHRASAGANLRVLGVALDGDAAAVKRYMQSGNFSFPVLVGMPGLRDQFTSRQMVPMTCLVDRQGRLRQVIAGEMAEDDVAGLASLSQSVKS